MRLKELMATKLFKECNLLIGNEGLENTISSAMILETLNIENYSSQNQLVMATLYEFQTATKEESKQFFQNMEKQGVSALIIKLNTTIKAIPSYLVEQSTAYHIPLIEAPETVSYEKILLAIYEPTLKKQEHLLRTYYEVRQEFTKVERNLRSFDQIMETFYKLIQLPCSLKIPNLEVDLHYGERFDEYKSVQQEFLETTEFTKNTYKKLTLFLSGENKWKTTLETQITSPIADEGVLRVYQKDGATIQSDLMILENAIDLIHEQIQIVFLLKKHHYTRMNNLADAILQNPPEKTDELDNLLDEANINSYPYFQGIAFSCKNKESLQKNKGVIKKLRYLRNLTIYFDHHKCTVILYNLKNENDFITKDEIKQLFTEDSQTLEQFRFSISQTKQKGSLKEILLDCLDGLRFNNSFSLGPIVSFNDLGVFQIFMRDNGPKQMMEAIPNNLIKLWLENSELFETLYTFFKNNRNYKKTSEVLFMHSKTARYRINKISDILMLDFFDPIQVVNYELATYFLHMKKNTTVE